jgi:hypothetical protein
MRAVGIRVLSPIPAAVLFLLAAFFYRRNNVLTAQESAFAARWGVTLSTAVYAALIANVIARRRPPWPWSRSLPWSSTQRVLEDAAVIALASTVCIVATLAISTRAALIGLLALPSFAIIAAAAIRRRPGTQTGASGPALVVMLPLALLIARAPWVGAISLASMPAVVRFAAGRERARRVTSWSELHHDPAGDTSAWRAG